MNKTETTGIIKVDPYVFSTKSGVKKTRVDIVCENEDGEEIAATQWSNDPADSQLFSFQKGDEVDVEVWQRGQYWNATILTPVGSNDDPEAAAERSMSNRFGSTNSDYDSIAEEVVAFFGLVRQTVNNNAELSASIRHLDDDAQEEVRRQATASTFIELNRKGLNIYEAFNS